MSKSNDIKKQVKKQDEEAYGDADNPEIDDDTDKMYKRFAGHEPKKGETIADEVEESEEARKKSDV